MRHFPSEPPRRTIGNPDRGKIIRVRESALWREAGEGESRGAREPDVRREREEGRVHPALRGLPLMHVSQYIGQEGPLSFLVSVPDPGSLRCPPLLCFLHGYDEGAPTALEIGVTRHGPLRADNHTRAAEMFVIVAPQLPGRGDLWHRYADDVKAVVQHVQQEHDADATRNYLSGFSFGGNGVFDLALLHPATWTALWAVDPTRVPRRDPGLPVWLSFGEVARGGKSHFIRALKLKGAGDAIETDRVYLDEGADHVGSATLAYQDPRIYAWLLSKRLSQPTLRR